MSTSDGFYWIYYATDPTPTEEVVRVDMTGQRTPVFYKTGDTEAYEVSNYPLAVWTGPLEGPGA